MATSSSSSSSNDVEMLYSDFLANAAISRPLQEKSAEPTPTSSPRILRRKTTRFQVFSEELSELVQDLLEYSKAKTWKKKCMALILCLSSILVFYDLLFGEYIVQFLKIFILWMSVHSIEAVFAFVGTFVVATCKWDEMR
jgi:hypothetical protein